MHRVILGSTHRNRHSCDGRSPVSLPLPLNHKSKIALLSVSGLRGDSAFICGLKLNVCFRLSTCRLADYFYPFNPLNPLCFCFSLFSAFFSFFQPFSAIQIQICVIRFYPLLSAVQMFAVAVALAFDFQTFPLSNCFFDLPAC